MIRTSQNTVCEYSKITLKLVDFVSFSPLNHHCDTCCFRKKPWTQHRSSLYQLFYLCSHHEAATAGPENQDLNLFKPTYSRWTPMLPVCWCNAVIFTDEEHALDVTDKSLHLRGHLQLWCADKEAVYVRTQCSCGNTPSNNITSLKVSRNSWYES